MASVSRSTPDATNMTSVSRSTPDATSMTSVSSTKRPAGDQDDRHDFGPALLTRCSVCGRATRDRGDKETGQIYCVTCYTASRSSNADEQLAAKKLLAQERPSDESANRAGSARGDSRGSRTSSRTRSGG